MTSRRKASSIASKREERKGNDEKSKGIHGGVEGPYVALPGRGRCHLPAHRPTATLPEDFCCLLRYYSEWRLVGHPSRTPLVTPLGQRRSGARCRRREPLDRRPSTSLLAAVALRTQPPRWATYASSNVAYRKLSVRSRCKKRPSRQSGEEHACSEEIRENHLFNEMGGRFSEGLKQ